MPTLRYLIFLFLGLLAWPLSPTEVNAAIVFTGTPEDSWGYSYFAPAGLGGDPAFTPTQLFSGQAAFQGYVTYTHHPSANFNSADDLVYGTNDSIHVFSTFIRSSSDVSIVMRLEGDDGHSMFFDGAIVGGGGFGSVIDRTLVLQADVARKLDVVGYNAGAPWLFAITGNVGAGFVALEDIPGVSINATGEFPNSTVPEPTSLAIWFLVPTALLFAKPFLRRRVQRG